MTLRLRLLAPDMEFVQLFWIGGDDVYFTEAHSMHCIVRSLREPQDLTFAIVGTAHERTIRMLCLDSADGPCDMLLEGVTVGRW